MPTTEQQAKDILDKVIGSEYKSIAYHDLKASDRASWNSARLAIDLRSEIGDRYSVTAINLAVAKLYHVRESTIRRRVHVANRIPKELVDARPDLSFSYWKEIADASHVEDKAQAISEVLLWIDNHKEQYKELPSVATVHSWITDNGYTQSVWVLRAGSVISTLDKLYDDRQAPQEFKILVGWCRGMINQYLVHGISPLGLVNDDSHHSKTDTSKEVTISISPE